MMWSTEIHRLKYTQKDQNLGLTRIDEENIRVGYDRLSVKKDT